MPCAQRYVAASPYAAAAFSVAVSSFSRPLLLLTPPAARQASSELLYADHDDFPGTRKPSARDMMHRNHRGRIERAGLQPVRPGTRTTGGTRSCGVRVCCLLLPSPSLPPRSLRHPTLSHCAARHCSDPMQDGSVAEPCWQQTSTPSILSTSFTRKASPASPSTGPCLSNPLTAPRYPRLHLQPCVRVDEAVSPPRGVQHSVEEDQAREDKTC